MLTKLCDEWNHIHRCREFNIQEIRNARILLGDYSTELDSIYLNSTVWSDIVREIINLDITGIPANAINSTVLGIDNVEVSDNVFTDVIWLFNKKNLCDHIFGIASLDISDHRSVQIVKMTKQ